MQLPPPEHEAARLEVLGRYQIIGTPPEECFDNITHLAAYICGTPIALVSFIDHDRHWFKAKVGWDVDEIPLNVSLCAHTILQSEVLVVSDTLADEQMKASPLATHGGVRFYAGVPLLTAEGYALGTLCVMDSVPRDLTEDQKEALRRLTHQVMAILDQRRIPRQKLTPQAEPTNVPAPQPSRWGLGEREICTTVVETVKRDQGDRVVQGGISFTLPLFNRGQELQAVGAARTSRLQRELDASRRAVTIEIRTAYEVYATQVTAVEELERDALPGLEENETLVRRSFEEGEIGLPELLLIRRESFACISRAQAERLQSGARRTQLRLRRNKAGFGFPKR